MRAIRYLLLFGLASLAACGPAPETPPVEKAPVAEVVDPRLPSITVSGDDTGAAAWNWQPPEQVIVLEDIPAAKRDAARALQQGRLYTEADDAIPMYLALKRIAPEDPQVTQGLTRSLAWAARPEPHETAPGPARHWRRSARCAARARLRHSGATADRPHPPVPDSR